MPTDPASIVVNAQEYVRKKATWGCTNCLGFVRTVANNLKSPLPETQNSSDPSKNEGNRDWTVAHRGVGWQRVIMPGDVLRYTWEGGKMHSILIASVDTDMFERIDNTGGYNSGHCFIQKKKTSKDSSKSGIYDKTVTVFRVFRKWALKDYGWELARDINFHAGVICQNGERFIKEWEIRNSGAAEWIPGQVQVVPVNDISANLVVEYGGMNGIIRSGEKCVIFITMRAPVAKKGMWTCNYRVKGPLGVFGLVLMTTITVR